MNALIVRILSTCLLMRPCARVGFSSGPAGLLPGCAPPHLSPWTEHCVASARPIIDSHDGRARLCLRWVPAGFLVRAGGLLHRLGSLLPATQQQVTGSSPPFGCAPAVKHTAPHKHTSAPQDPRRNGHPPTTHTPQTLHHNTRPSCWGGSRQRRWMRSAAAAAGAAGCCCGGLLASAAR
jgi:hypothetical protein